MDMDDYQEQAIQTLQNMNVPLLMYAALGFAGEAGEVANKVKKVYRDDNGVLTDERRLQIAKELGGALWYLAVTAKQAGFSLDDIAFMNLMELRSRRERGTIKGDGDDR